jgi:hypothetical protein
MNRTGRTLLLIGAGLNFAIAAVHVAIVILGAPAYTYFGTIDLARLAAQGSPIPAVVTLALALIFAGFAVYALAGAGVLRRPPLLRVGLVLIGGVYVLRGLIVVLDLLRLIHGAGYPFRQTVFSAVALITGLLYLVGTFLQRDFLRLEARGS